MDKIQQLESEIASLKMFIGGMKNQLERIGSAGGGAGSAVDLEYQTKTVYSDYHVGRRDYYVGVQHQVPVSITLPVGYPGRTIVIKDESGFAGSVPITINGKIDGDETGMIININHGSITFLYNNGWRRV